MIGRHIDRHRFWVKVTIALQVLTLMEFVSRKKLSQKDETISGLVPGNPKMKTPRPIDSSILFPKIIKNPSDYFHSPIYFS